MKLSEKIAAIAALASLALFTGANSVPLRAPVAVFVHGGGWVSGTTDMGDPLSGFFTLRRFLFESIDYPKPPAVPLAASVTNISRQIATAVRNGPSIVIGHSAGAHLVATAAFRPGAPLVKCLILLDGVGYDFVGLLKDSPTLEARLKLSWRDAGPLSPAELVTDSPRRPVVYLAAGGDSRRTADQARQFAHLLRGNGMDVTLRVFPAATHNDFRTAFLDPASPISQSVNGFLAAHPACST